MAGLAAPRYPAFWKTDDCGSKYSDSQYFTSLVAMSSRWASCDRMGVIMTMAGPVLRAVGSLL